MNKVYLSQDSFAKAKGSDQVQKSLEDQGLQVSNVGGYGLSWLEPILEIPTTEGRLAFKNVQVEDAPSISALSQDRSKMQGHPKYIGVIDDLPFLKSQNRLVLRNTGYAALNEASTFTTLKSILNQSPDSIIKDLEVAGLRGRGGAGFPAHIKWRTVADAQADQKYIVCNADEGDSGTFSDRILMEADPDTLIEGMAIAGYACGASEGYIYLRSEYPHAYHELVRAISRCYSNNQLGHNVFDTDFSFDLQVFVGAGAYICGEETSLLESLEGKRGQIRIKPPLPAIAGLNGKPTLVHNVITLASIPSLFDLGAEHYGSLGVGASKGTMPFQLAGNIQQGGLIELEFGHSVRELVEDFGQGTRSNRPVRAVQIGGPLGAYLSEAQLDTPLTYEAMQAIGAGIGHGGLVVFDETVNLREQAEFAFEFCEIESCGKCTPCRIGSVRGKELIRDLPQSSDIEADLKLVHELCDVMEQASLCQMGGMTPIPVRSAIQHFPGDFKPTG